MATYDQLPSRQAAQQEQQFSAEQAMAQQNAKMAALQAQGIRPNTNGIPGQMAQEPGLGNPQATPAQPMQYSPEQVGQVAQGIMTGEIGEEQLAQIPTELANAAMVMVQQAVQQNQPQGLV